VIKGIIHLCSDYTDNREISDIQYRAFQSIYSFRCESLSPLTSLVLCFFSSFSLSFLSYFLLFSSSPTSFNVMRSFIIFIPYGHITWGSLAETSEHRKDLTSQNSRKTWANIHSWRGMHKRCKILIASDGGASSYIQIFCIYRCYEYSVLTRCDRFVSSGDHYNDKI
jgi:hypothetical protein